MTDPRTTAVEDNLVSFYRLVGRDPLFTRLGEDDVAAFTTQVPFALFNCVIDARFDDASRARRTAEVADRMVAHGLPWMWWATPSGMPDDHVLTERGLSRSDTPGMHVDLDGPVEPRSDLRIAEASGDGLHAFMEMFARGFGMPDFVTEALAVVVRRSFDPARIVSLVAWDGRTPVGCGSVIVDGTTAGLYNIATPEEHRGRGVGYAVTAALMNLGVGRGCTRAVLQSSDLGRPVYERIGFEQVCTVPQYVWHPATTD
ncbi:GNAT family N-acetyltransferase [Nocardioides guangzhouensis]|uniref:GNAT family N-acetyltransferase n=1 Tax=Nocardioides guangzhouensis TaxID=2497878 RepID=A0A4Q4ZHG2_9ACTN|nr:GNAT family N-acetyltransferase [Nocardioides guangzhouensis]RYP86876.1 GNAT family N-acetyltransferase [Nocardioides guangzhouensis]